MGYLIEYDFKQKKLKSIGLQCKKQLEKINEPISHGAVERIAGLDAATVKDHTDLDIAAERMASALSCIKRRILATQAPSSTTKELHSEMENCYRIAENAIKDYQRLYEDLG